MSGGTFGFKGFKNRALELPAGVTSALAVDISPGGRARLRYNDVAKQLEQSIDGGAYTPLGGTGAGPWDQVGTDVFPDSTGWNVTIGAAAVSGTERLRVVGDSSGLGGIRVESDPAAPSCFLEMNEGDAASLSSANEGRIIYSRSNQRFEASENGGVYVPLGGAPSAPVNSLQYNNAGSFGGSANLTFDGNVLAFSGTNVDLDPTGSFALDMAAGQSVNVTLGGGAGSDMSVLDSGGNQMMRVSEQNGVIELGDVSETWDVLFSGGGNFTIGTSGGNENTVRIYESNSDPTPVANYGQLYCKDVGAGVVELFYQEPNGPTVTQLTPSSSPWTEVAGVVYPNNATDDVVIGGTTMIGTEKLRVIGPGGGSTMALFENGNVDFGTLARISATSGKAVFGATSPVGAEGLRVAGGVYFEGDIDFSGTGSRSIDIAQSADDTPGNTMSLTAGDGGNFVAISVGAGGQFIAEGGDGGTDASPAGTGGAGGTSNLRGGAGGAAPDGGGTGGVGGNVIVEGGVGGTSGGTQGTGGGATLRGGAGAGGGTAFVQGGVGVAPTDPGGNVFIDGGAAGSGLAPDGAVNLGASNTSAVNVGSATATVNISAAGGNVGFFGVGAVARPNITGPLSTVADTAAQTVMTSIIAALTALGLATDGTT